MELKVKTQFELGQKIYMASLSYKTKDSECPKCKSKSINSPAYIDDFKLHSCSECGHKWDFMDDIHGLCKTYINEHIVSNIVVNFGTKDITIKYKTDDGCTYDEKDAIKRFFTTREEAEFKHGLMKEPKLITDMEFYKNKKE